MAPTPDWMSSLLAMARSLRFTSFSIPNLNSGRGTVAANPRVHTEFRTSGGERFSPAVQAGRAAWRIDNDNQAALTRSSSDVWDRSALPPIATSAARAAQSEPAKS
jgi:hypothetical protein